MAYSLIVRTAIKQITSVFFIFLSFTPMLSVHLFIKKQKDIQHRMKERMEEKLLHTVIIPDAEVQWIKKEKEILVDGKMFDIKSFEHEGALDVFHGLFDDEETALNIAFNKGWKKNSSGANHLLMRILSCMRSLYFVENDQEMLIAYKEKYPAIFSTPSLITRSKTILTPPPQV